MRVCIYACMHACMHSVCTSRLLCHPLVCRDKTYYTGFRVLSLMDAVSLQTSLVRDPYAATEPKYREWQALCTCYSHYRQSRF